MAGARLDSPSAESYLSRMVITEPSIEPLERCQRAREVIVEVPRPGVEMRLECGDDAALGKCRPGRLKSRFDLGGMMSIVVDDRHARDIANSLKAPLDATERFETGAHRIECGAERNP